MWKWITLLSLTVFSLTACRFFESKNKEKSGSGGQTQGKFIDAKSVSLLRIDDGQRVSVKFQPLYQAFARFPLSREIASKIPQVTRV